MSTDNRSKPTPVTSRWSDGYVSANGIRLHYHRSGGDKPALVMAHGVTDNGLCWSRLARALEADFDLIMVDARGHGLSDKPEGNYNPQDHAADLAGLIEALGLAQPAVIGHSMGGASAAFLADRYPQHVGCLILEDPGWFPPEVGAVVNEADNQRRRREFYDKLVWRQTLSLDEVTAATRRAQPRVSCPRSRSMCGTIRRDDRRARPRRRRAGPCERRRVEPGCSRRD